MSQSQVNLALDIELRISGARLEIISLISAISSGSGYLACIETKVVKNAFCIFPKATPNAKSFSSCICNALFEGSKKTFTMSGIAITIESIYCSKSPLIITSIAIKVCHVMLVLIYRIYLLCRYLGVDIYMHIIENLLLITLYRFVINLYNIK